MHTKIMATPQKISGNARTNVQFNYYIGNRSHSIPVITLILGAQCYDGLRLLCWSYLSLGYRITGNLFVLVTTFIAQSSYRPRTQRKNYVAIL